MDGSAPIAYITTSCGKGRYSEETDAVIHGRRKEQTMSDDLIRREDAIKAVEERSFAVRDSYTVKAILRNVPSADRPSGEWIRTFDGNEWFWYCSNCKTQWYEDDLWMGGNEFPNFCPNCGADMREREEDDEVD